MIPKEKIKDLRTKMYIACQEYTEEIQCSLQADECTKIAVEFSEKGLTDFKAKVKEALYSDQRIAEILKLIQ